MSGLLNLVFIRFRDNDNSFVIYCRRVLKLEDHCMGGTNTFIIKEQKEWKAFPNVANLLFCNYERFCVLHLVMVFF